jgi:hypothetical protein
MYKSPKNENIDFDTWRAYCQSELPIIQEVEYGNAIINIKKVYTGLNKNVYKVVVECTSDIVKYFGYARGYDGNQQAINDFNRVVEAIQNNEHIYDEVLMSENGRYICKFSPSENFHLFIDAGVYPVQALGFSTRTEAEDYFNGIVNG